MVCHGFLWVVFGLVFLSIFVKEGMVHDTGGFLFFRFLCYENHNNKDSQGFLCDSLTGTDCDPFFTICISDQHIKDDIKVESCPILYNVSSVYKNQKSVCVKPEDNRGPLGGDIIKEFVNPLKKTYYVKIEIRDWNLLSSYKPLIGSFSAQFQQTPSPNLSKPLFKVPIIYRNEFRYANPNTSLEFSIALQCGSNVFGEYCQTWCRRDILDRFTCSGIGEKICQKGWKGKDCSETDLCFFQQCAEGAKCIENEKKAYCMCDGKIGPKCYPNYNPCSPNPCINSGQCAYNRSSEQEAYCFCNKPFYGQRCEYKHSATIKEQNPCQNNGEYITDDQGNRRCKCVDGFRGDFCQKRLEMPNNKSLLNKKIMADNLSLKIKNKSSTGLFILKILTISTFSIFAIMLAFYCCRHRKAGKFYTSIIKEYRKKKQHKPENSSISYVSLKKKSDENTYETIEDFHSISYVMKENDDYVSPSEPKTESNDAQNTVYTLYTEMTENGCYGPVPNVLSKEKERVYSLPPLPKNSIKRKSSLGLPFSRKNR